jgi:hypothetical protein
MTSIFCPFGCFVLLISFKAEIGSKMGQLRIGEFGAQPTYRHPQFAGQKELKFGPTVLL